MVYHLRTEHSSERHTNFLLKWLNSSVSVFFLMYFFPRGTRYLKVPGDQFLFCMHFVFLGFRLVLFTGISCFTEINTFFLVCERNGRHWNVIKNYQNIETQIFLVWDRYTVNPSPPAKPNVARYAVANAAYAPANAFLFKHSSFGGVTSSDAESIYCYLVQFRRLIIRWQMIGSWAFHYTDFNFVRFLQWRT